MIITSHPGLIVVEEILAQTREAGFLEGKASGRKPLTATMILDISVGQHEAVRW